MQSAGQAAAHSEQPDALLQARVLEAVQRWRPAEARVDRHLLLGVRDRAAALDSARERRLQAAQRLAEDAVGAAGAAGLGRAHHDELVVAGVQSG
jgi:predicted metal-dependent TIM-barrel fold hydrolase